MMAPERAQQALDRRGDIYLARLASLLDQPDFAGGEIDLRPGDQAFFEPQCRQYCEFAQWREIRPFGVLRMTASRGVMTRGGFFFSFICPVSIPVTITAPISPTRSSYADISLN
jgi:hypothetical protein